MIKKTYLIYLMTLIMFTGNLIADDIVGFWKTINEETKLPESIVAIYKYQDKYYGRLIVTFDQGKFYDSIENPKGRAEAVKGHPFFSGLDFIWDLEKEGSKYSNGTILDPDKGDEYAAEAWLKEGNLIVRGEVLFLGKNQVWPKAQDADFPANFKKPDLTKFVPKIPETLDDSKS